MKGGQKNQSRGFPERKHSSPMSYSPLLYEPESFMQGSMKPPTNRRSGIKSTENKKSLQPGKKLDPIGAVSENQTGWLLSGDSSNSGMLSGKGSRASSMFTYSKI